MLEGGEDPRFIVRRMVILASEDIGNADPRALEVAVAAAQAVEHVGLPEGQYALAQAAIYLSLAPKSDAAKKAIGAARAHVARARRQAAAGLPAERGLQRRGAARAAASATTTPTTAPGTCPTRSWPPRAWRASASTRPTRPRPRCASAWRRSAGRAAGSVRALPPSAVDARHPASRSRQLESLSPATGERLGAVAVVARRATSPPPWT